MRNCKQSVSDPFKQPHTFGTKTEINRAIWRKLLAHGLMIGILTCFIAASVNGQDTDYWVSNPIAGHNVVFKKGVDQNWYMIGEGEYAQDGKPLLMGLYKEVRRSGDGQWIDGKKNLTVVLEKLGGSHVFADSGWTINDGSAKKYSGNSFGGAWADSNHPAVSRYQSYPDEENQRITDAWVQAAEAAKDAAEAANTLLQNSQFVLKTSDDNYFAKYYPGKSYYYPRVGADPEVLQFDGDATDLTYDTNLQIKIVNTTMWEDTWKSYNLLGTYADGVYYYDDTQEEKASWKIESAEGKNAGDKVMTGDKIRLLNKSYEQYLYPSGKITTTKAAKDADTIWIIQKQ